MALILVVGFVWSLAITHLQVAHVSVGNLEIHDQPDWYWLRLDAPDASPTPHRLLSRSALDLTLAGIRGLGLARPEKAAFGTFRIAQLWCVLLLAGAYYRKLGYTLLTTVLGLCLLGWAIAECRREMHFSLSAYTEISLYLLAAWIAVSARPGWIIPVTGLALFTRETGVGIPLLLLLFGSVQDDPLVRRRSVAWAGAAVLMYVIAHIGLSWSQETVANGAWDLVSARTRALIGNTLDVRTYGRLFASVSVIPILAFASMRWWPRSWRRTCVVLLPFWLYLYLSGTPHPEGALLLVPHALLFIPAVLSSLEVQP